MRTIQDQGSRQGQTGAPKGVQGLRAGCVGKGLAGLWSRWRGGAGRATRGETSVGQVRVGVVSEGGSGQWSIPHPQAPEGYL